MTVGENIKKFRKEKGLTQKELGELCGINEVQIRRYELGGKNSNPKIDTLKKIATALNVNVSDLVEDYISLSFKSGKDGQINGVKVTVTDSTEAIILNFYRQLNDIGKNEAYKRIGELTLIESYQHNSPKQMPRPIFKYKPSSSEMQDEK